MIFDHSIWFEITSKNIFTLKIIIICFLLHISVIIISICLVLLWQIILIKYLVFYCLKIIFYLWRLLFLLSSLCLSLSPSFSLSPNVDAEKRFSQCEIRLRFGRSAAFSRNKHNVFIEKLKSSQLGLEEDR